MQTSIKDLFKHLLRSFLAVYYFQKKTPSQMFDKVLNTLLRGISKIYQLCLDVQKRHYLMSSYRICVLSTNIKVIAIGLRTFRSSHQRCSVIKGVVRNFTKFTGKRLCLSLFFNKVSGLEAPTKVFRPTTLLKKRLWHRCFPVNFVKFLRTAFLQNNSGRLRLTISFLAKFIIVTHQLLNPLIWCCSSKLYVWKFRLWCKYFSDIFAATE